MRAESEQRVGRRQFLTSTAEMIAATTIIAGGGLSILEGKWRGDRIRTSAIKETEEQSIPRPNPEAVNKAWQLRQEITEKPLVARNPEFVGQAGEIIDKHFRFVTAAREREQQKLAEEGMSVLRFLATVGALTGGMILFIKGGVDKFNERFFGEAPTPQSNEQPGEQRQPQPEGKLAEKEADSTPGWSPDKHRGELLDLSDDTHPVTEQDKTGNWKHDPDRGRNIRFD